MKLVTYKNYVAGWLDTSIHDILEVLSASAASTKYALITCLDSNPHPATMIDKSPELQSLRESVEVRGAGLLLRTDDLLEAERRRPIFFGFDEVLFFPNKRMRPKPASLSLVGPARPSQARINKIGKWMTANFCAMALGGGEGLNFVVRARGLVRFLLGSSIEQPEPSLATMGSFSP
jgi:hypothetical protein